MIDTLETVAPFTPLSSRLLVKLTRQAEETRGGVILPEISRRRPSEGTVLAAGPGRRIEGLDQRTVIWPVAGDRILFAAADFTQVGEDDDQGLVRAESVIGIIDPDTGEVTPENAWVKIAPDSEEKESSGGVWLPDRSRKRAKSGVVLDFGPGETRSKGPLIGTRIDSRSIMGLNSDEPLIGRQVYWETSTKVVHIGGEHPCAFIKANDLCLIGEADG